MNNGGAGKLILDLSDQQRLAGNALAVIDDVRAIIAKSLNIPIERLTPDSRLDELGAESLDVIEIVFGLEEKFDITIPLKADEATRLTTSGTSGIQDKSSGQEMPFSTVGDVADIVQKLVAAKVAAMNRVVVTGIGVVSPIGSTREKFWSGLVEARSGIGPIKNIPTERLTARIAAQVLDFDPAQHFDPKRENLLDRFSQFAVVAARAAVQDANWSLPRRWRCRPRPLSATAPGE